MTYVWIFIACFVVSFLITLGYMSKKLAVAEDNMRLRGMSDNSIDIFYKSMVGPTIIVLIRSTVLAGSILGGCISLIVYLIT